MTPRVANWASTYLNHTSGYEGQKGGNFKEIAQTVVAVVQGLQKSPQSQSSLNVEAAASAAAKQLGYRYVIARCNKIK